MMYRCQEFQHKIINSQFVERNSLKSANNQRELNQKLHQQFQEVLGIRNLPSRSVGATPNTYKTSHQKDTSFWSPQKSIDISKKFAVDKQLKMKAIGDSLHSTKNMDEQKSQHFQRVVQDRAQNLQQMTTQQKRQRLEGLLGDKFPDEELIKTKKRYDYSLNDYDGKLLQYPLLVDYLKNKRYLHADYIQNHILGETKSSTANKARMKGDHNAQNSINSEVQTYTDNILLRSNSSERAEAVKRIQNIVERYSQSPVQAQREKSARNGDKKKIYYSKFDNLLTIVSLYKKNRIRTAKLYETRFTSIQKNKRSQTIR